MQGERAPLSAVLHEAFVKRNLPSCLPAQRSIYLMCEGMID